MQSSTLDEILADSDSDEDGTSAIATTVGARSTLTLRESADAPLDLLDSTSVARHLHSGSARKMTATDVEKSAKDKLRGFK